MHRRKDFYRAGGYNGRSARRVIKKEQVLVVPKVMKEVVEVKKPGFIDTVKSFWNRQKRFIIHLQM